MISIFRFLHSALNIRKEGRDTFHVNVKHDHHDPFITKDPRQNIVKIYLNEEPKGVFSINSQS